MTLVDLATPSFHLVIRLDLLPIMLAIRVLVAVHAHRKRSDPAQQHQPASLP